MLYIFTFDFHTSFSYLIKLSPFISTGIGIFISCNIVGATSANLPVSFNSIFLFLLQLTSLLLDIQLLVPDKLSKNENNNLFYLFFLTSKFFPISHIIIISWTICQVKKKRQVLFFSQNLSFKKTEFYYFSPLKFEQNSNHSRNCWTYGC